MAILMLAILMLASNGYLATPPRLYNHPVATQPRKSATTRCSSSPASMNLLEAASDGDIAAVLETAAIGVGAALGVGAAWSLVQSDQEEERDNESVENSRTNTPDRIYSLDVDLGKDGEPKGISRLMFKPLLPRSELLLLELRTPLGLLIEETESSGGAAGESTIVVKDALPGYSAMRQVEPGDLIRAVTAYAMVAGDAPMWQQVTSGTPVGDV